MSIVTAAQAADFLAAFDKPSPEVEVKFEPLGAPVLVRSMGLSGRLAQTMSRKNGADFAPTMLAACVFKLDHVTNEYLPFASAQQWEQIGRVHYVDTLKLINTILDLSKDPRGDEKN